MIICLRGVQSSPCSLIGATEFDPFSFSKIVISESKGSKSTRSISPLNLNDGNSPSAWLDSTSGREISIPFSSKESASHSIAIGIAPDNVRSAVIILPMRPAKGVGSSSLSHSNQSFLVKPVSIRKRVLETASVLSNHGAKSARIPSAIDCNSVSLRFAFAIFKGKLLFSISSRVRSLFSSTPKICSIN